jgi:hypothetical protein
MRVFFFSGFWFPAGTRPSSAILPRLNDQIICKWRNHTYKPKTEFTQACAPDVWIMIWNTKESCTQK